MVSARFDVNDEALRADFLREKLFAALGDLSPSARPQWGGMSLHQMVEHLVWALEMSWERAHFKHFYHHLLQFGLLEDA